MNKNFFFNAFPNEDNFLIASIWEDIQLCLDIDYPIYGSIFLPPSIWSKLENMSSSLKLNIKTLGANDSSEKKMVIFYPQSFKEEELTPNIIYFKIDGSNKFKNLQHKDFLGTIMSLGLKRESLGDIIVSDNIAFGVTTNEIFQILSQVDQVNRISVKVQEISKDIIPESNLKDITVTVPSYRLDSIISSMLNLSRNACVDLIESGQVSVNYIVEKEKNKTVLENSVITVKKYGKYILKEYLGENKKGKFKIFIQQYI